jgi:erythromycin esterase
MMKRYFTRSVSWDENEIVSAIRRHCIPLDDEASTDPLLQRIGDARIVMLGESSHGTHEYYTWRARITKRLIREKGFRCIAVECEWPDCYRVNRYIKGFDKENTTAFQVLHAFNRWPTWMWANWEIVAITEWLPDQQQIPETYPFGV